MPASGAFFGHGSAGGGACTLLSQVAGMGGRANCMGRGLFKPAGTPGDGDGPDPPGIVPLLACN
eukprot:5594610-Alexandrium_andersonii.AAC.2